MGRRHEWKDPEKIEKERLEALKKKLGDINDAPEKTVEMKTGESQPPMVDYKQAMASNSMAAVKTLEDLSADPDSLIRAAVAANPRCPVKTLKALARDARWNVCLAVAMNEHAPACALNWLAGDEKPAVRRAVASNPAAGRRTLERLAYSSDIDLKRALARNDKATASLLDRLYTEAFVTNMIETDDERLQGKLAGLKNEIAENPHTGVSTLKKLAEDKDELVRVRVFLNGRTPAAVKRELIKDEKVRDHWLVRTGMEEAGGEIKKVYDKYKAGGDLDVKALAALFAGD